MDKVNFILNTSANYFGSSTAQHDDTMIKDFFEYDKINLLAAFVRDNTIIFDHQVPSEQSAILFYKLPHVGVTKTSITCGNEQPFGILTLEGGIVKSMYNSFTRVYSPKISNRNAEFNADMVQLIDNLVATLSNQLGVPESGVRTIHEEVNYWTKLSRVSPTKSDKDNAKSFATILEKLGDKINDISAVSLANVEEFLDTAHTILDDIWKLPYHYPQNRMADIMDIICITIIDICVECLHNEDIWDFSSAHVAGLLVQVAEVVDTWTQMCDSLTRLFWPNCSHPWLGEPHVPRLAYDFKVRLEEIKHIRNLYTQMMNLLIADGQQALIEYHDIFKIFKRINVFDTSIIGNKNWMKSVGQFELACDKLDEKMAAILKSRLKNHFNNPRQIIHIFSQFNIISSRPKIMDHLSVEREHFLQSIRVFIKDLQSAIYQTADGNENTNLSAICSETRWLKVVEHQIHQIEKVMDVLKDHDDYQTVKRELDGLNDETKSLVKVNFETWCETSLAAIRVGDIALRDDKPVVEFEKDGRQLMRVTFNGALVTFCHDTREFENLGFQVANELQNTASHASRFISYARVLQQICTFHNTIGDRMIQCQRPIMLKNAVELSNLVRSESVAWNNEESVSRYVKVLQEAVARLSKDNTLLAGYHEQMKKILIKLMNTDLLRHGQVWKDEMRHLRDIIGTLESQGYTNLQAFKLHWDHQLYKVLEHQYIAGLIDLNHKLPDIHIDILFRQQQLQFRPQIEEIKSKYYTQLGQFLERPLSFRGLTDQSNNLFKIMVERNRHHFGPLYNRGENLFRELEQARDIWIPWVALGCVDLEQMCHVHLSTWEDWDKNFRACKHFSQQVAKIQNTENRIDCFNINLAPLRTDIEQISRRYWEILSQTLRQSILADISTLHDFLQQSLDVFQNISLNERGIAESGAKYEKLTNELPKMSELIKCVQSKDTCLASWCKERVTSLTRILGEWDQLQPLIDNHHEVLQRQIDFMRDQLTAQIGNLTEEADKFSIRWDATLKDLEASETADLTLFKDRQQQWLAIQEKRDSLIAECEKFGIQFPEDVTATLSKVNDYVLKHGEQWTVLETFNADLDEIGAEEWTVYSRRPYMFTDFLSKWSNKALTMGDGGTDGAGAGAGSGGSSGGGGGGGGTQVVAMSRVNQSIEKYRASLPVLQMLQSDALIERHWTRVFQYLGITTPKPVHDIRLGDVLSSVDRLVQIGPDIQNLVRQAASEQIVRQALAELEQWGVTALLKTTTHTDSSGHPLALIKDFQDVLNKIGDNQSLLQSAKNSAAFETFSDQAEIWEARLNNLDQILTSLNVIQRKWIYLEPVFGRGTLRGEEALFNRIDKDFRFIMREISNDTRVVSVVRIQNVVSLIHSLEKQLSLCQNTLASYITNKRNSFPRFFFLGDDDLLELLGQATKINIVQKHVPKLFPGIHHLGITIKGNLSLITAIHSAEGDEVKLENAIDLQTDSVEEWLNRLLDEINVTLQHLVARCATLESYNEDVIEQYPVQVLCLVKSIEFTKRTEHAISSVSLETHLKTINDDINRFNSMMANRIDSLSQIKLRALLLDRVHHATVVEFLIQNNVTSQQDWHWMQQLKFYLNTKNFVIIRMVYAEFEYSYEYVGNVAKLVNTSLTHKCYLTLTQAMHLGLGGNPFGPAGTGKTECVKALGAMLGRLVLVFNCNENVDATSMGLILSGLARCGAWGCFDEFNRLEEATLSAISSLIQPLQTAIKEKRDNVLLLDNNIPLNANCGIFVTLNPAGEEYGGRRNLPGNIQSLFRPIVMQRPEPKEIARVILFVEGFKSADTIGARMVELFEMANKMLSPQRHYDWGLRELKTVLTACGKGLRETNSTDSDNEMQVAVVAVRSNTMSKLTLPDYRQFDMLVKNIFPGVQHSEFQENVLRSGIEEAFSMLGLEPNQRQLTKCMEIYEQITKRMGVVIVGPPCSGKTTILSILKQALVATMQKTLRTYTLTPKSMSRDQLLGKLDNDTRQWCDGVLTATAVAVNSEPSDISSWIICEGDVDPDWIEALNSVLDDNRLLTLPSGWRIQFGHNVNFVFETHDLSHASPATISRMGIVNLSYEDLPPSLLINNWTQRQTNSDLLVVYTEKYLEPSLQWILSHTDAMPIRMERISLVKSVLAFLSDTASKEEFCIDLMHAMTSVLMPVARNEFARQHFQRAGIYVPDVVQSEFCHYNKLRDVIEVYQADTELDGLNSEPEHTVIKTPAIKVSAEIVRNFLKSDANLPFMLVGPAGSGKSLLLRTVVDELTRINMVTINCSAQLNSNYVLYLLKQHSLIVSGIRGKEYKSRQSKNLLFFKNIDLCPVDSWGTSEIVELLLQLIHRNGFYADNLEWISVSGLQVCCSTMFTTKQVLSPRFLGVLRIHAIGYPNDIDFRLIVKNQMKPIFERFKKTVKIDNAIDAVINIFTETRKTFTTNESSHYVFTPKMVVKWLLGLTHYPEDFFTEALNYEALRIFHDRLLSPEHCEKFRRIILAASDNNAKIFATEVLPHFFVPMPLKGPALQFTNAEEWDEVVKRNITVCNAEDIIVSVPMTPQLLTTVASLVRCLSRMGSHIVLAGMTGSGRQEALHIAGSMLQIKVLTMQVGRGYGLQEFSNDLKMAIQSAALDGQPTVLFIHHTWIKCVNDIMKLVEAVLQGSELYELFGDDLETIAGPLKNVAQLEGFQESLSAYFWKRAWKNLHILVQLESSSSDIQELFETYPALHLNAEIIWLQPLADEILRKYPMKVLQEIQNVPVDAMPLMPSYFLSSLSPTDHIKINPKRLFYLTLTYQSIYNDLMLHTNTHYEKLASGVEKLSKTRAVVAALEADAIVQEDALAEKRKLAAQSLQMISTTMKNANNQRIDLLDLQQKTKMNSDILLERKRVIELELKEVEPMLQAATVAVGQIKTEALSEIRSLRAPPDAIRDILEGVLRLMGIRDTSWNSMKTFLAKRGVKEDIRSLDPARITPENCAAVEVLLKTKADSFDMKNAKRASAAAAPLAAWVTANVQYSKVIQSIKPLEREQSELQKNLADAQTQMNSLSTGLDDVDEQVKMLSVQLNAYTQEAAILEIKLDEARKTLQAAQVLVEDLNSEFSHWTDQLQQITHDLRHVDLKAYVISLIITHLSHLTQDDRHFALQKLVVAHAALDGVPSMELPMKDQEKIIWESMGLTPDNQSMQNATLLTKLIEIPFRNAPIPLVLDPSGACTKWLSEYLKSSGKSFELATQSAERFTYTLELAVRFGRILIVDDAHNIVFPLLSTIVSPIYSRFNKKMIQIGTKIVDFNDEFKLILLSNATQIDLPQNIAAYIAIIPFTTTSDGLTDQLMSKTIQIKLPKLEEKRIALLQNDGQLWNQRAALQNKLLEELSTAQGDILRNEKLISTLKEIKQSSASIDQSLADSSEIRRQLMPEYEQFKPICGNAAKFYIGISKIYDLPVAKFLSLFIEIIKNSDDLDQKQIYAKTVRSVYSTLGRFVPKSDYVLLALQICKHAYPEQIGEKEWESFVTNFMSAYESSDRSLPEWIKPETIPKLLALKSNHPNLYQSLNLVDEMQWKPFMQSANTTDLPITSITPFDRILVTQVLRPDFLVTTLHRMLTKMLGFNNLAIAQPTLATLAEEISNGQVIILKTSSECDPSQEIHEAAKVLRKFDNYTEIAAGKGQENNILMAIRNAACTNAWITIKNVHLVPELLNCLDTELQTLNPLPEFRLWLICDSLNRFTESFLGKCNKILYENPSGVKFKVSRLMQQWEQLAATKRNPKLLKIFVILFTFNAIIQERRSFIPQGWTKWYDFGDSDIRSAIEIVGWMERFLSTKIEWPVLRGLIYHIAYGGRIDNVQDQEILIQHLETFFDSSSFNDQWRPLNFSLKLPQSNNIHDYQAAIAKLSDTDMPSSFGLPTTTNVSRDLIFCRNLLKQLRTNYFANDDQENVERRVRPIMSLWKKLTENNKIVQTFERTTQDNDENSTPWKVFIQAELRSASTLFTTIQKSFVSLRNVIRVMTKNISKEEQLLLTALAENRVPAAWHKIWNGPKLAIEYIRAVAYRGIEAERRYVTTKDEIFSKAIDLATVFNVESFLAALKLSNARQMNKSPCDLMLSAIFQTNKTNVDAFQSCKVTSIMIEGASFQSGKLSLADTEPNWMPAFELAFLPIASKQNYHSTNAIGIPFYSNNAREHMLCVIELPTAMDKPTILFAGVALTVPDLIAQ